MTFCIDHKYLANKEFVSFTSMDAPYQSLEKDQHPNWKMGKVYEQQFTEYGLQRDMTPKK